MEYTVQRLGRLAGVSARTLRYYDEIGILKPARINSSGYRIYGGAEVDRLQQILFYRELGVGLDRVKELMDDPAYDAAQALRTHREELLERKARLEALIASVDRTLAARQGGVTMSDEEKFEGFKDRLIVENEAKYGAEIRAKYGEEEVRRSNEKLRGMSEAQYAEMNRLAEEVAASLAEAFAAGDPTGEAAQRTADLHRQWLSYSWSSYSKEAHAGLAQMYVDDERFKAYYEKQPGMTEFLRDAIFAYTGRTPQ